MSRALSTPSHAGRSRDSVVTELTRDFRHTLRAAKRVLGDNHRLTIACLHAIQFPFERMSSRMVREHFETLPLPQRTDLLQVLRR